MSDPSPLSKTAKYKKITKPLLERKRRARINRCLDELKDIMVGALDINDDNMSKLEKADILELTVNHLTKLHSPKDPVVEAKKFQAGFGQCAAEACRFIMSVPDLDSNVSQNLISHLSRLITAQPLTIQVPDRPPFSPPTSPASVVSDRQHYYSDHDRSSSDAEDSIYSGEGNVKQWVYSRSNPPHSRKATTPMTGLLTTVDKIPAPHPSDHFHVSDRRTPHFNRVPADAKDVILQKIRQHIMDKRGNDYNADNNSGGEDSEVKYYRHEVYRSDANQYSPANVPNNDTLDLRKYRSPAKSSETALSPKKSPYVANQLDATPLENKTEATPVVPEQCELPMDYSNLPPKKKRKLIEYQEYKKQEEARRQLEAFYAEQKSAGAGVGPPADDDAKWRPW
ncbi:transcription factor HES-4-A [Amyelois transitella]|uniref:transcription factor HES-4-A n=1 Tax=Amyelois transitella TaxID=680683 RepID=UPI002990248F|nr:transcription factor HES-4-A [Amyelois transitella]XP_060804824.1 transcription factor HES-4-A [Amyelois transitella]XP_060804825.1 transcription factor HES-4-A [Amyelois transitella]XP_060804826.1 transcription factor HES-4-A [Amyelois transitella]